MTYMYFAYIYIFLLKTVIEAKASSDYAAAKCLLSCMYTQCTNTRNQKVALHFGKLESRSSTYQHFL